MSHDITLPELGENIETATVVEILVTAGDQVARDQALLSLETDKAEFELPSTATGVVEAVLVRPGDEVRIGQAVVRMRGSGDEVAPAEAQAPVPTPSQSDVPAAAAAPPPPTPAPAPPAHRQEAPAGTGREPIAAAPSVRRLARTRGLRLEDVVAHTGNPRVTAADVEAFDQARSAPTPTPGTLQTPLPDFSRWGEISVEPMSKIRRKTAENMARAWVEIPTVTHFDEADITALDRLRKRFAPRVREAGGTLTWTAILLHVVAGALKRFPQFNASVDMAAHQIILKRYVHIGVAVDTERGLRVPVIRDADQKNVTELATALAEISEAARSHNIKPDLMQGATFTITNLGGIGGVGFSPIVNPPQVAILGVSRASVRPVWRNDTFEPRQMLPLALSYDHRIIDGADAARFLRWVCEALAEPFLLDLEGQ